MSVPALIHNNNMNFNKSLNLLALHFLICKIGFILSTMNASISKSHKKISEKSTLKIVKYSTNITYDDNYLQKDSHFMRTYNMPDNVLPNSNIMSLFTLCK